MPRPQTSAVQDFQSYLLSISKNYDLFLPFYQNKMSKLRSRTSTQGDAPPNTRIRILMGSRSKNTTTVAESMLKSRLFEQTRCHTIESDGGQVKKESLFNRNISAFRDSSTDSSLLPFLASLRNNKDYCRMELPKGVSPTPFEAERETINQKIKKSISDIEANPFRLSKAYYRWNKQSGLGMRSGCEFECSLRMDKRLNTSPNPEASSFKNVIAPIPFRTVEPKAYAPGTLVCDQQKRLFTLDRA